MKRIGAIILCLALMITSASQMAVISLAVGTPTITCESKECNPGDTVSVEVNLTDNPGVMYLELTPTCSSELGTPTVQNGSIISDLTKGKQYVWTADNDVDTNGTLVTMTFTVAESVAPGDYSVSFIFRSAYNYNEDLVAFTVVPATIRVKAKPVPVTGFALDKTTATVETGDGILTLTPIFTPETATNKNLAWDSTDNGIATVKDGVVTLIKKGVVTITATTEDGGYKASCVVTINCSHRMGHDVAAEESTCIKHGHEAYTVCDECGEVIDGSDAELPFAAHTGGTATCLKKAVCAVCGEEYGKLGAHNYTETAESKYLKSAATCVSKAVYYKSCSVCGEKGTETFEAGAYDYSNHKGETYKKNQKEATCFEEGYTGDVYCRACDREISKGESIPKNAHNPASVWTTDGTYHWKECQTVGCGNQIDKAPHSGGEATCVTKAVCSVCGVQYGKVNASNHKHTEVRDAKDATCCEAGYTGDTWCTDCNTKIATGTTIPATGNHVDVDGKWESGGTSHWHTCYFGTKFDVTAHSGGEATCVAKAVCSVCGVQYGKVDASNHKHTEVRDAKSATCCEAGYTGDTWCTDCNTKIATGTVIPATGNHIDVDGKWETDVTNHWHTCYFGTKFDITAHSGGEATCKDKAVCSVCGVQYGEVDASNHKHTEIRDAKAATEQEKGYTGDTWCLDCSKKVAEGKDIEKLEHKPVLVKAEDATAAKEGNIEYYYCDNCGKYYSDEVGTKEIAKEATVITKLAPKIIDGNNAKIDTSSKEPVSFRSDASFADFIRVELDGKELIRGKEYTLKEGSIIATLTPEFAATLTAGEHTLGIVSASGTAVASFTVTDKGNSQQSPQTGDNNNLVIWSLIATVSFIALCTTTIVSKKKKVK